MDDNPYQAPDGIEPPTIVESESESIWQRVARFGVWTSAIGGLLLLASLVLFPLFSQDHVPELVAALCMLAIVLGTATGAIAALVELFARLMR